MFHVEHSAHSPYDASGNLQNDQLGHAFSYDAENRPYSAGGVTYYYDGEGERVAKSTGKLYLFGTGSAPAVETDATGTTTDRVAARESAPASPTAANVR